MRALGWHPGGGHCPGCRLFPAHWRADPPRGRPKGSSWAPLCFQNSGWPPASANSTRRFHQKIRNQGLNKASKQQQLPAITLIKKNTQPTLVSFLLLPNVPTHTGTHTRAHTQATCIGTEVIAWGQGRLLSPKCGHSSYAPSPPSPHQHWFSCSF